MRVLAPLLALSLLATGCYVQAQANPPVSQPTVTVVNKDQPPPAASPAGSGQCRAECRFDLVAATGTCSSPAISASPITNGQMTASIDMRGFTALQITLEACDSNGWTFHLGDSPTNDGYGGDAASTSNDAELQIVSGNLAVYGNDEVSGQQILAEQGVLPTSGCGTFQMAVSDQQLQTAAAPLAGSELFRIDPPADREGTPDATWYLGANRTYRSSRRAGTGLRAVTLCLQ